jgi:hypothetical protein
MGRLTSCNCNAYDDYDNDDNNRELKKTILVRQADGVAINATV